jgi:prepilin-type N-terminal cleavage/methylation domain-containing protein
MRSFPNHTLRQNGFTVVELLIAVILLSALFLVGFTGFQSFLDSARTTHAIRAVTSAFSSARYRAIQENKSVKVCLEKNQLVLKQKRDNQWQACSHVNFGEKIEVSMNASPVFSPTGFVSPLCSVHIKSEKHLYKITLSMAGRIKVTKIK